MKVKIERIADLFDDDIVEEMLSIVNELQSCHWNSGMVCYTFKDWDSINYCEGYINNIIGHAINVYTDYYGNKHYFDVTSEYNISKGYATEFHDEFELVKEYSGDEIIDRFNKDGIAHLLSVENIRIQ